MYDFLKKVPFFADLNHADLERLCEMVDEVHLEAGEQLFAEGDRGDRAYVIKDGQVEIIKEASGRPVLLSVRGTGDVIGEMSLLEDAPRMATVRARTPAVLLAIQQEQFEHLIDTSASAARAIMHTVLTRYRATTGMVRQSEKMAQLGTLTAGVAHELNNPAAAVKRGSEQLRETSTDFAEAQAQLSALALSDVQREALMHLAQRARDSANKPLRLDSLQRSDLEYEVESWLEELGVEDAWELAPTLVNLGYTPDNLDELSQHFDPDQLQVIVRWLGATYAMHDLLSEISQGAMRISEIVKALKSYAYLDQAPVQVVDLHEGLDNTLLILRNKLRTNINVRREYDPDLPTIEGYGSELNQVWTNLIDNAIDALENTPSPEIVLRTHWQGDWVYVDVIDNGPGIPKEIQPRLFDAFFTTKPPGKGTGLGLDISYNIVATKHRGDIRITSRPGRTCFHVSLPINFENVEGGPPPVSHIPELSDDQLREILQQARTVAVVGISDKTDRPAHTVPAYLQRQGYHIIPVNPRLQEVLGEKAYPDLMSVPEPIDVVQIFRRSEEVPSVVEQAIKVGARVVWMQEGIVNEQAGDEAQLHGLTVVMDQCMRAQHRRLIQQPAAS